MNKQTYLTEKLSVAFQPHFLSVENESHLHSSDRGGESHFKVTIVSDEFINVRPVARHQKIYQCLQEDIQAGIHALALHTFTKEEWARLGQAVPPSTNCMGIGH